MLYRKDKYGNKISQLGFGCMRFSRKGATLDYKKAESEILRAVEGGINYFDTAYIYPGSEKLLGRIINKNDLRDKIYIATKLPQYNIKASDQIEKIFKEQLERLQTNHINYYLMHMFLNFEEWEKLQKFDIASWIEKHKSDKSIGQIGFSYHGNTEDFLKILNAYDWDFCQIQYNYMDENSQAGRKGLEAAYAKNIPVIIMEPIRGGRLAKLPKNCMKLIQDSGCNYSPSELSLRWLWNQPGVTCVLSGMKSIDIIEENLRVADTAEIGSLDTETDKIITNIVDEIRAVEKVGCTGCEYCQPCPKGVEIPKIFLYYNLMQTEGKWYGRSRFAQTVSLTENPGYASKCIECGRCEKHCPQAIAIRKKLKEADQALRPPHYKLATWLVKKFWN